MSSTALKTRTLTKVDRCDRCGAEAYVRATVPRSGLVSGNVDLLFCAHHGRQHLPKLRDIAVSILDESEHVPLPTKPGGDAL